MYVNSNEVITKQLKKNMEFLNERISEIKNQINKLEENNQSIAPITQSVLELNESMRIQVEGELKKYDA